MVFVESRSIADLSSNVDHNPRIKANAAKILDPSSSGMEDSETTEEGLYHDQNENDRHDTDMGPITGAETSKRKSIGMVTKRTRKLNNHLKPSLINLSFL